MGQAKSRGNFEKRREDSKAKMLDHAEVLIACTEKDGSLLIEFLPRDETPNQDSMAVIFASYINSNYEKLAQEARALYLAYQQQQAQKQIVVERSAKSIVDAAGNIIRSDH